MSLSNKNVVGFAPSSGNGEVDDITLATSKYWRFGINTLEFDLNTETHEWRPEYFLSNRDPNTLVLQKTYPDSSIAFLPVNGLWFYYFLGDSATVSGVHTLSGINSGNLPRLTYRWEDTGGTANEFSSILGNVVESLVFTGNFGNNSTIPIAMGIGLAGIKQSTPVLNSVHNGPEFPTDDGLMGGTQISNLYRYDSNMSFIWDQSGSNDDYTNQLAQIQYTGINFLQKDFIVNQAEREFVFEGNRAHSLLFRILRGTNAAIFDDFYSDNLFTAQFKIYNTASNYIELTFNNVGISKIRAPFTKFNKSPFYQCECVVGSITPVIKDGIANSYYGD